MNQSLLLNPPISIKKLSLKINLRAFWISSFILIALLLGFYIFQVNKIIQNSYLIKKYEKKLSAVTLENNNLKINFAKFHSLDNIEKEVFNLNFEKIGEVKYIQILGNEVVVK